MALFKQGDNTAFTGNSDAVLMTGGRLRIQAADDPTSGDVSIQYTQFNPDSTNPNWLTLTFPDDTIVKVAPFAYIVDVAQGSHIRINKSAAGEVSYATI